MADSIFDLYNVSETTDGESLLKKFGGSTTTQQITQFDSLPLGVVLAYYSNIIPNNYLLCNGSTFNQTTYPDLYVFLGNSNVLPDLRGYFLRGLNTSATGVDPNRTLGSIQTDLFKSHNHQGGLTGNIPNGSYGLVNRSNGTANNTTTTTDNTAGELNILDPPQYIPMEGGTETRPKNISVNYIIKAVGATGNTGNVALQYTVDRIKNSSGSVSIIAGTSQLQSSAALDMGNFQILGLATPNTSTSATNRDYVDTKVSTAVANLSSNTIKDADGTSKVVVNEYEQVLITTNNTNSLTISNTSITPYRKMTYSTAQTFDNPLDIPSKAYIDQFVTATTTNKSLVQPDSSNSGAGWGILTGSIAGAMAGIGGAAFMGSTSSLGSGVSGILGGLGSGIAGQLVNGALNASNNPIKNLPEPTTSTEPVRLQDLQPTLSRLSSLETSQADLIKWGERMHLYEEYKSGDPATPLNGSSISFFNDEPVVSPTSVKFISGVFTKFNSPPQTAILLRNVQYLNCDSATETITIYKKMLATSAQVFSDPLQFVSKKYVDDKIASIPAGGGGGGGTTTLDKIVNGTNSFEITSTEVASKFLPLNMYNSKIIGLPLPTLYNDASTKGYVDTLIASVKDRIVSDTSSLIIQTGSLTSNVPLTMNNSCQIFASAPPTNADNLTNKAYVDQQNATRAPLSHSHTQIANGTNSILCGTTFLSINHNADTQLYFDGTLINCYNKLRYNGAKTFIDGRELVSKTYVDNAVASIPPAGVINSLTNVDNTTTWTGTTAGTWQLKDNGTTRLQLVANSLSSTASPYNFMNNGLTLATGYTGQFTPLQVGRFGANEVSIHTKGPIECNSDQVSCNNLLGNSYISGRLSINKAQSLNTQYSLYVVKQPNNNDDAGIYCENSIMASQFVQVIGPSDRRLKTEIQNINVVDLENINLVQYRFDKLACEKYGIERDYQRQQIGFIAQDVPSRYTFVQQNGIYRLDQQKLEKHLLQYHQIKLREHQGKITALEINQTQIPLIDNRLKVVETSQTQIPLIDNRLKVVETSQTQIPLIDNRLKVVETSQTQTPLIDNRLKVVETSQTQIPLIDNRLKLVENSQPKITDHENRIKILETANADLQNRVKYLETMMQTVVAKLKIGEK